jgi:hypothetical protein
MPQVTVYIPEELKKGFKELSTEEVDTLVSKALRREAISPAYVQSGRRASEGFADN